MRGGLEEFFDVKYERPPLVCYFCGKLGHGVKDCVECIDVENPTLAYGGWIKASPWRKLNQIDTKPEDQAEGTCARRLFTVKPKTEKAQEVIKQVEDVLGKFEECRLEESLMEKLPCPLETSAVMQHDWVESFREDHNVTHGELAGNVSEDHQQQRVVESMGYEELGGKVKKKGWKRMKSIVKEASGDPVVNVGVIRKHREEEGSIEELVYLQNYGATKKRGVDNTHLKDDHNIEANMEVAGPTQWALGDQC